MGFCDSMVPPLRIAVPACSKFAQRLLFSSLAECANVLYISLVLEHTTKRGGLLALGGTHLTTALPRTQRRHRATTYKGKQASACC